MKTIGIFGDHPTMPTGMGVVCHNLALALSHHPIRVIFFGRFGCASGFSKQPVIHDHVIEYELVQCEGGVWRPRTVIKAVEHYEIDYIFSEDDFFSAAGLVRASKKTGIPLHFLTPIDSLPIHPMAHKIFKECSKVYTPNSSYKKIKNGVYLPHGVNTNIFYPMEIERDPNIFTFLWIGRDEPRKALGRFILAFDKVARKVECQAIVHSDWRATLAKRTARWLRYKRDMPIILSQMEAGSQDEVRKIINAADVLVCTSKAGGFEMSITEAMACGLPTLVTDWTFMNEAIRNYDNGFRIPVVDTCGDTVTLYNGKRWGVPLGRKWGNISINALADAMRFCVDSPEEVKHMGRRAMQYTNKYYNWIRIGTKLFMEITE